jgi:hypothetical protein
MNDVMNLINEYRAKAATHAGEYTALQRQLAVLRYAAPVKPDISEHVASAREHVASAKDAFMKALRGALDGNVETQLAGFMAQGRLREIGNREWSEDKGNCAVFLLATSGLLSIDMWKQAYCQGDLWKGVNLLHLMNSVRRWNVAVDEFEAVITAADHLELLEKF